MVRKILQSLKNILFVDPELIFAEEKEFIRQPFYFKGQPSASFAESRRGDDASLRVEAEKNRKGILLIHGWTSTAYEVRRLGRYLNENGFTVSGPMLRGHGTNPEDLETVKWQDWLEDLSKNIDELKKDCDQIYIGGTSIGASLAILLALEKPEIKGLILMAAPYKIKLEKILRVWGKFIRLFRKYNKKYYPPTFGATTTITRLISYQKYSIKSALEVGKLVEAARGRLLEVKVPCFLIQSREDHVVSFRSMDKIYDRLGSAVKKKKYIKRAYHTFISDIRNEHVFQDILNFLKEN